MEYIQVLEGTGKAFAKETNLFTFLVEKGQQF
jgi:hypothetical protein